MKKYFAVAISIAMLTLALIFSTVSIAQAPKAKPQPKTNIPVHAAAPKPALPPIDATIAQTLSTLAGKIQPLEQQQLAIKNQLVPLHSQWNAAVGQAIAKAKDSNGVPLDPCAVTVSRDGKKFVAERQSGSGCR